MFPCAATSLKANQRASGLAVSAAMIVVKGTIAMTAMMTAVAKTVAMTTTKATTIWAKTLSSA